MNTEQIEFVMGWHKTAENVAKNMGLETSIVEMPGGYSDRLYIVGSYSKIQAFKSFPQIVKNKCLFSPGYYIPGWVE